MNRAVWAIGPLWHKESTYHYQCVVAGKVFNGTVINPQTLLCNLTFTTAQAPNIKTEYDFYVIRGFLKSNTLPVYFACTLQSILLSKLNPR